MKAWIASRGDPRLFERLIRLLGVQQRQSQRPAPESQPFVTGAKLNPVTHVCYPCVEIAHYRERCAESHLRLRIAWIDLASLLQNLCSPLVVSEIGKRATREAQNVRAAGIVRDRHFGRRQRLLSTLR
jgi:hypothetical protein